MHAPDTNPKPFPLKETEFVAMMASFQALQALAIDVMLPALGAISTDLKLADPNQRQLLVGVFLICSGLGSLFPGAIADRFGRRPVILTAICGYILLSLVCAFASSFELLLVARGVMGAMTSAMMVMPMTILRDRFEGDRMARTQSLIGMTFMVVPMIAPMLGQTVLLFAGWRWIFGIMGVLGVSLFAWAWMRLPETLDPKNRQPVQLGVIVGNMKMALRERAALGYFLGAAFVQGVLFGYINSSQQLVGEHFGAGTWFPAIFGGMAFVMACTNFVNSRIVEKFGARRVSHAALLIYITLGAVHFVVAQFNESLWVFVPLMCISMCMMSFMGSNFQAISLQPFGRIAGAAASVTSFVRLVLGALIGSLIGQAYDGTARPIMAAMVLCGLIALGLILYSERGRLFRRVNKPVIYPNGAPRP